MVRAGGAHATNREKADWASEDCKGKDLFRMSFGNRAVEAMSDLGDGWATMHWLRVECGARAMGLHA